MARKRYRLKTIWYNIHQRCNDKSNKYYGGKGIKVCEEWDNSFSSFESWALSHGYNDSLTIDRIDSNGNYCPENCRWATVKEQNNNNCSNRYITIDNETKTFAQWCEYYDIPTYVVENRVNKYGWDILTALTTDINETNHIGRLYDYNGETHCIREWSRIYNMSYPALYNRLVDMNWDIERALTEPVRVKHRKSR